MNMQTDENFDEIVGDHPPQLLNQHAMPYSPQPFDYIGQTDSSKDGTDEAQSPQLKNQGRNAVQPFNASAKYRSKANTNATPQNYEVASGGTQYTNVPIQQHGLF